ncbi:structure-specific recognition protein 1 [Nematocida sp. LUAm3]|nr:structure-specific recognition protein 1 [Nematocida sp. LUAm3]KAI5175326.1 structure-specific recognition protein 1 [Nematocida sp. LUAm2]KAI5177717.1 structure-specific recognition protein 1 [Nematocida sp. LUAm1]
MDVLTVEDVYYSKKNIPVKAIVKMATSGIGIKEQGSTEIHTIKKEELKEMVEHYGVIAHLLKLTKKDGVVHMIDGLTADAIETIRDYAKRHYKMNLYHRALSVDGNIQGEIEVLDAYVEMKSQGKTLFEVPLDSIASAYERRGEGIIDIKPEYFGVSEIRFGSLNEENSNVEQIIQQIKNSSASSTQTELFAIEELYCVLPRGKLKLALTSSAIHLIGKTYSHQILFNTVIRMFSLEKSLEESSDEARYLILELNTPIRQGQTRYHYVILLVPEAEVKIILGEHSQIIYKEDEEEEEVEVTPVTEEDKKKLAEAGLNETYEGPLFLCLLQLLEHLTRVEAYKTGEFTTGDGNKSLKCSTKANEGYIYPLPSGLLFIPKITYINHKEISMVEFSRVNLSSRTAKTFDMRVILNDKKEYMFNGLQKTEFATLEIYLTRNNVSFRSEVIGEAWEEAQPSEESESEETASDEMSSDEEDEEEDEDEEEESSE